VKTNTFSIAVLNSDIYYVKAKLKVLEGTVAVESGGVFSEDDSYSNILISTFKNKKELEDWMSTLRGVDYVGVDTL
jgi:hypothetical protein